jgi:hypothetical protein
MTRSAIPALALGCLCAVTLAAQQPAQPTPDQQQAKIRLVMEFYRPGITPEERIALIHPAAMRSRTGSATTRR